MSSLSRGMVRVLNRLDDRQAATKEAERNALAETVICPRATCRASVGAMCLTADSRIAPRAHAARLGKAEKASTP